MHFVISGFDGVDVSAQFHISPHAFIVDIVSKILRNLARAFGQLLGVIRKGFVTTGITVFHGLAGIFKAAAKVVQFPCTTSVMEKVIGIRLELLGGIVMVKLSLEKQVIQEKIANSGRPLRDSDESFRTPRNYLSKR